jgi:hypothetical protein
MVHFQGAYIRHFAYSAAVLIFPGCLHCRMAIPFTTAVRKLREVLKDLPLSWGEMLAEERSAVGF